LVERTTRFVVLVHLPGDRKAETVRDAMARKIATLPEAMLRSITSTLSEEQLDAIADELNGRPRETLGWRTPSERFAELVAMTG